MQSLKKILRRYSNAAIAKAAGVPGEFIHMLRKGQIDECTIKQLGGGRALPTRKVLEQKIIQGFSTSPG